MAVVARRAAGAQRVAQGDGAAVRVHARIVVGDAQLAQHGQALRGEGLVQLDHVHLFQRQAGLGQHLARRGRRADAHDARRDAGGGHADHARGVRPWRAAAFSSASSSARRRRSRPRRCRPSRCRLRGPRPELASASSVVSRGCSSLETMMDRLSSARSTRARFRRRSSLPSARGRSLLAGQREQILVFAADLEVVGHVLGGLRHGVHAVLGLISLLMKRQPMVVS